MTAAGAARAVDSCLVLLCLAAPSWRAIPQCVPPITTVLRDLALGRAFPTCGMSGAGTDAAVQWASVPSFCPPQYVRSRENEAAPILSCDYVGAITVIVDGSPWSRTWWNFSGDSVTEFLPAARGQLGRWDTRFDDEFAAWLAMQPPAAPACTDC